ncbi:hypothetical protein HED60_22745 [Planctomycetales bacterium ZRK34]|nr:hypothetical protein HED60_22745 [Planctomycetales bacterium ZRK34]
MKQTIGNNTELIALIESICAGEGSEAQRDQLAGLMQDDAVLRRFYVDYMQLHAHLRWELRARRLAEREMQSGDVRKATWRARLLTGSVLAVAAAIMLAGLIGWYYRAASPESGPPASRVGTTPPVAILTDFSADAEFSGTSEAMKLGGVLEHGALNLKAGKAQVMFNSTAVVDLTGPCAFELTGLNRGRLIKGRLQAYVPAQAKGFSVTAGRLRVVDLGTRFSLSTDEAHEHAQVRVLEGRVRVEVLSAQGEVVSAHELDAYQVAEWSSAEQRLTFGSMASGDEGIRVDLADLVAGGDGTQDQRGKALDPVTGASGMTEAAAAPSRSGDHRFHPVKDMPMVDGVFVPDNKHGPIQIDSLGRRFNGFGDTGGECYDLIWSGIPPDKRVSPGSLKGVDYAGRGDQWLWMHPNKAVTFDLAAVEQHYAVPVRRLTAEAHYLTPLKNMPAAFRRADGSSLRADLWVIVDGETRFVKRGFCAADGPIVVDVPLERGDRMLTLAVTGGVDGIEYDWVVVEAPTLHLWTIHEMPKTP